ncbi:MAG: hypothetical protein GY705_08940 [Bacteroidetes bacterium]|nr:hypothetical protein [Bacteroidota bacterium]
MLANISKSLASHKSCHTSNLSKISNISNPQSQKQEKINALWEKADKLADFVDGDAPYEERIKHLPELLDMTESLAKLMGVKYTRI